MADVLNDFGISFLCHFLKVLCTFRKILDLRFTVIAKLEIISCEPLLSLYFKIKTYELTYSVLKKCLIYTKFVTIIALLCVV